MRFFLTLLFSGVLYSHALLAQTTAIFKTDVTSPATPWTGTDFYNNPVNFQFAIVSDRTNGHRDGVFEDAVDKLNGMKPEFVLNIGDVIEGYTKDTTVLHKQWAEFEGSLKPLTMPFFHVPGNHDVSNDVQHDIWMKKFGRDYYYFIYKNVLFIAMNSNDGDGKPFSEQQLNYVKKVIQQNKDVRWTFLLMHHPVWNDRENNGFSGIEETLKGRPYTVIAGHTHHYLYANQNGHDYYVLGTTGGSNQLRGSAFGETDHISWVTMTEKGPSLMNLELKGMLKPDFSDRRTTQLAASISKAASFKPFILLPSTAQGIQGQVYFNLDNKADLPLEYHARAYQHSALALSENVIAMDIPVQSTAQKALQINARTNTGFSAADSLLFQWQMNYKSQEKGLPALSGILKVPVLRSVPQLIDTSITVFTENKTITVINPYPGAVLRYTTDGKDPEFSSLAYNGPFLIKATTTVKIKVFSPDGSSSSATQTARFNKIAMSPAVSIGNRKLSPGLNYAFYEGAYKKIPDFSQLKSLRTGVLSSFNLDPIKKERMNQFAMLIDGLVKIDEDGLYHFYLTADDGCNLYLDDQLVVKNDGSHSARTRDGFTALKKGLHKIRFEYFEDFDGELIKLEYSKVEKENRKELPFSNYMH